MLAILLSLMLALQMTLPALPVPVRYDSVYTRVQEEPRMERLMWGMLDPELSAWYARVPSGTGMDTSPIAWRWGWQAFWAALFQQPIVKEASGNAQAL